MKTIKRMYYLEFAHEAEEGNYTMQSVWCNTSTEALKLLDLFDYISDDIHIWLMRADFYDDDSYDIEEAKHIR